MTEREPTLDDTKPKPSEKSMVKPDSKLQSMIKEAETKLEENKTIMEMVSQASKTHDLNILRKIFDTLSTSNSKSDYNY